MCGIAVILPGSAVEAEPARLDRMVDALRHRGPDAQAALPLDGCLLGHTRLSVIDPAGGAQPMSDDTARFSLVFNGEIYNYPALRRELEGLGERLRTASDTEVLLLACRRFGAAVLPRLNGQFAFAVWDARDRTLFVARDRFGEKPLFRASTAHGGLVVASEVGAVLASGLVRPRIDPLSVDAYLGLYYVPPDRTIYENIHPLPPAHAATWRDGVWTTWRYWSPRYDRHDVAPEEAAGEVRERVGRAVRRQMAADVPVGAFLSGGLDSSTIVAEMSRHASSGVKTFSVGFGDLIDELPFARDVARACGTEHHELQMDIDVAAMLCRMTEVYDEPFGDSSNVPTFLVAEHARRSVKVVLSGDGGDEIFGGYDWYAPLLDAPHAPGDWWERHVAGATPAMSSRAALWGGRGQPAAGELLRERYRPAAHVREMNRATHFDVACYLPGDILVKVDRAAMAHGLETRSPFLDVELAEFVLGLPWRKRFGEGLKSLLKAACAHLWPESVRGRKKQGFGAPVRAWLQLPAVRELWDRVTQADAPLCALLPGLPAAAAAGLRPQRQWTLLCLGLWLERRKECLWNLS